MRKTLGWLLVVMSLLVAVLALGSALFSIGELRNSGERASGAEYSIVRNALAGIKTKEDLKDDFLRQRLIALYKGSDRLLAAQVLDASGLVLWKLPGDSAYFALPGSPSSRAGFSAPEWSTVVFTTPLDNGMKLATLFVTLKKSDMANAARTPLIILAIWFAIVVVVFFAAGKKKSKAEDSGSPGPVHAGESESAPSAEAEHSPEAAFAVPAEVAAPMQTEPESAVPSLEEETISDIDEDLLEEESAFEPIAQIEEKDEGAPALPGATEAPENRLAEEYEEIEEEEFIGDEDVFKETEEEIPAPRKNFEESLARLEEEIANWSSRHGELKAPPAPDFQNPAQGEDSHDSQDDIESLEAEEEMAELEELSKRQENEEPEPTLEAETPHSQDSQSSSSPVSPIPAATTPILSATAGSALASLPLPLSLVDSELEAKLRDELERGPKTEVSLMLIHCSVNSATDPAALALAVTVRDYIGAKDLIFELYKGAFAVVLPSVDLGGSLKMSEDLADVLSATLGLYRDIEGDAPVYIGISARSERKVDAFKLYREASTALHKAFEGGQSRILAFRPKVE
jgi:hypothetical protein